MYQWEERWTVSLLEEAVRVVKFAVALCFDDDY